LGSGGAAGQGGGMIGDKLYGAGVCALPSCPHKIPEGFLLCGLHWRLVPGQLQRDVYRQLRRYQVGAGTLAELRAAQDAAVAAVHIDVDRLLREVPGA
jgi:hypothetical protein